MTTAVFQRHDVFVDSGDLADQTDEAWDALTDWGNRHDPPRVFVKDGVLARATDRAIEPYDRFSLREESSRAAKFLRTLANGTPSPRYPPVEIVDSLLRRDPHEYRSAPRVSAVVDVPVVAPDGGLVIDPGLHESGLYYRPAPGLSDVGKHVATAESVDDVQAARDFLLTELLGDFDFVDESSRANALGLVLVPFVRHLIGDDPTPMHAVVASQAGTGKTFLVQTCLVPACGLVGLAPSPRDADELRKLITSSLLSARPAVVFDNIPSHLASEILASVLTSRVWQDRVLGQSKEVDLPVRCVWATTGNNITTTSELVDRVCPIFLDHRGKPARHRSASAFRHPDLHGWALRNRTKLVGACLTLITHWLEGEAALSSDGTFVRHEHRQTADATLGSFERWADVVGGVLAAADVRGFLGNLEQARSALDVESEEILDFLSVWRERLGDQVIDTDDLVALCQLGGVLHPFLPDTVDHRDVARSLKRWLRSHRGQTHGGLSLHAQGPRASSWSVRQR